MVSMVTDAMIKKRVYNLCVFILGRVGIGARKESVTLVAVTASTSGRVTAGGSVVSAYARGTCEQVHNDMHFSAQHDAPKQSVST